MQNSSIQTVIESAPKAIRVLFSHREERVHRALVPALKAYLNQELRLPIEVISKFSSEETLRTAMDNVFDIIILSRCYGPQKLSTSTLCHEIKKLDKSIPVIVFASQNENVTAESDAQYPLPNSRKSLQPLLSFLKPSTHSTKAPSKV